MIKIVHLPDSSFYTELISNLTYDNDTLIYNELTDEMFRFVLPTDTNQTFDTWKSNLPKYTYKHRGNITQTTGFGDLSDSYESYDIDEIFSSELSPYFMIDVKVYWQKKIGGTGTDFGYGIAVDSSGNVCLVGYQDSDSYGSNDYGVIKLDTNGNLLWQKKIGGTGNDMGRSVAFDSLGNIYLSGAEYSDAYAYEEYGVIKLDPNGNILWQKKIGGSNTDQGYGIAVDGSGNVYLNGYQKSDSYGNRDFGVIKLDTNGNEIWQKKIGGVSNDEGYGIAVDGSGNVYLNGHQESDVYGSSDFGIIKLDTNGNLLWQKKIGGTEYESSRAIDVDSYGNVYSVGRSGTDINYSVIKLDSSGNLLWQKKIGDTGIDIAGAIVVDSSGNVYINGQQNSSTSGAYDFGVIKLDTDGNIVWQKKIGGINSDQGLAIALDSSNNVYVNGFQLSDTYGGYDFGVMKLYTDQDSDMTLPISNSSLSIGNMSLSIDDSSLSIGDMTLSIGDSSLSIGDLDMSGDVGGELIYLG